MGVFSGIKEARANQGGVYPLPGNYVCEIQSCKIGESRKKEPFFVADLKIISSDNDERKVGTIMSWMAMSSWDGFEGMVKAFIMGVMGVPEEEIDEDVADSAISEEQPLAGMFVRLQAQNVKTKKGTDFTRCNWFSVSEEEAETAKAA